MSNDVYLTRDFYHKKYDELDALKKEKLKISEAIEEARLQGDLSENAEYDAAKEAQAYNASISGALEDVLARTKIIEDQNIPGGKIYIGAIVTLKDLVNGKKVVYQMVAPEESDVEKDKISYVSPIGKGLMTHIVGDEIYIKIPSGDRKFKVLDIKRP